MVYAFWKMCYCHKDKAYNIKKNSRSFEIEKYQAILIISKTSKGKIRINNGVNNKMINPESLTKYIEEGWNVGGKPLSDEQKMKLSKLQKK